MLPDPDTNIAKQLLDLLDAERDCLCSAQFDKAAALGERKLELIADLDRERIKPAMLARLQRVARRNARLLGAAAAGLRDGAGRLDTIRTIAHGFSTYDQSGRRGHVAGCGVSGVERRA